MPGGGKQAPKSAPRENKSTPKPEPEDVPKPAAAIDLDSLPPQLREVVAETQAAEKAAKEADDKPASLDQLDTENLPPDLREMVEKVRGPGRQHSAADPDKLKKKS